jgi:hypothetical protein
MFRNHPNLSRTVSNKCEIIFDYSFYILNAGFLNANVDFIPEVLGRYRIHKNSFGQKTSRSYKRREQSLRDIEHGCRLAKQFNIDIDVIEAGIRHHRFAAALYFLERNAFHLFFKYIELASSTKNYFNIKHKVAYENRHNPKRVKELLSDCILDV